MGALVRGLVTTANEALRGERVTQQYPEEHYVPFPRFRGRHVLRRHENGLEKCVGCSLCAAACPAHCIRVIAGENTEEHRVSEGERYAEVYEIHMLRCIFCGFCVEACPTEALGMTGEYELATYSREAQLYDKARLLEPLSPHLGAVGTKE
ncbi:MAG: NADH-quinone oxidoreductase subunit NuoI [Armatimonadetes bacterium]|nr:NADH-quinone oxidoreductase subunit NuoI [Armatimonadota bacterium]